LQAVQRFGLFGGSFNPVHLGHLLVAQAAREELSLDRLFFIPAAQSPFKPENLACPWRRAVAVVAAGAGGADDCEVDDQEIARGGVSYTIDTVRNYARRFPDAALYYLIGADHLPMLPNWREATELAQRDRVRRHPPAGRTGSGVANPISWPVI
jgi:nicotinate-nucleotide adenylyltransferase